MILINTKTNDAYICSMAEVGRRVGVVAQTVSRWRSKGKKVERYNHWLVYLKPSKIKKCCLSKQT